MFIVYNLRRMMNILDIDVFKSSLRSFAFCQMVAHESQTSRFTGIIFFAIQRILFSRWLKSRLNPSFVCYFWESDGVLRRTDVVRHPKAYPKTFLMLKKSFKYLVILFLNLIILTILLALWTDKLELIFNDLVRLIEFIKIIGFTIGSLIAIRILIFYFRTKNIVDIKTKIKIVSVLTLLISSYLYIDYSSKLISNRFINGQIRQETADKIKSADGNGTKANSLTVREYQEITKINWFPKLPNEATNISYSYEYDGFLPDYYFILKYNLPREIKIDTVYFKQGEFTKSQIIEFLGDEQRITYTESLQ